MNSIYPLFLQLPKANDLCTWALLKRDQKRMVVGYHRMLTPAQSCE
jgi:hypothetical protein